MQMRTLEGCFVMNMRHFLPIKDLTNYSKRNQDIYNFLRISIFSKNTGTLKLWDCLMVCFMFPNHIAEESNYLETTGHSRMNTHIYNDVR